MSRVIDSEIFVQKHTVAAARFLLGKILVRQTSENELSRHLITETEAYHSQKDLACHASKGRTARTDVLFRGGGIWYVYLCYGIHEMLNLVVGPPDFPAAVLLRAVHDATGPGRLTKALKVGRQLNGVRAAKSSGLWLEDAGFAVEKNWIQTTPRIGVDYAGKVWAAKPWRFLITKEGVAALTAQLIAQQPLASNESPAPGFQAAEL